MEANEISDYRQLMAYLSGQLVSENMIGLKDVLKDHLGEDYNREGISNPSQLFHVLEEKRLIHENKLEILKECLVYVSRHDLVEAIEKYEQLWEVVAQKKNVPSSILDEPFFGREDLIQSLIGVLREPQQHIHVVCISGMPGAGKTRLAYEACHHLTERPQLISVDLREITTVEGAFFAIMHRLNVECQHYQPELLFSMVRKFSPSKAGGAILLLDSADYLLDPGTREKPNSNAEHFVDLIQQTINLANPKLKLVITSRAGLEKRGLNPYKVTCFCLEGDNELSVEDGVKMMQHYAGNTKIDGETCEGLVKFCGKVPLAIKVIGSRFQDGKIKPKDLLEYMKSEKSKGKGIIHSLTHLNLPTSDQLSVCLESSIRALPNDHKNNLIKLAVIPGSFSLKAARDILNFEKRKKVELQLDLQALMNRCLLESDRNEVQGPKDPDEGELRYSMHLLLRSFIQQMAINSDEEGKIYRDAESKFIHHYGGKLRKICRLMEKDYVAALSKRDADHANYQEVLLLLQSSTQYDSPEIAKWLNMAVSHLMIPKHRRIFFQKRAQMMKDKNLHSYADYRCHEMYQLLLAGEPAEPLLKNLNEAEKILKSLPHKKNDEVQLSLALCYQVKADVLVGQGRLAETQRRKCAKDAMPYLEKALKIREKLLEEHFLTARTYLGIGIAWQTIAVIDPGSHFTYVHNDMVKALDHYQKALDMLREIAGSLKHMEMPNVLVSMGACMHEMGRHEKAVELYREALTLEEALGVSGTEKTCLLLKNMAMSYYTMERYEDALKLAQRALEGRKALLETHQNTARAIYFVGLINMMLKRYKEARKYFEEALVMEETLWRQGKQHSEDWTRLKERMESLMEIEGKPKAMRKYKKRFKEAEKHANQAERNPDEDDASEEGNDYSSSSSEGETGKKRKSSTSASSLHSADGKVQKLDSDNEKAGLELANKMEKQSIDDDVVEQPNVSGEAEQGKGAIASRDVEVKFLRYSDPEYDDHDSIEECYGIDPRRGPWEPKKNKKKTKKAGDGPNRGDESDDSDNVSAEPQPSRRQKSSAKKTEGSIGDTLRAKNEPCSVA